MDMLYYIISRCAFLYITIGSLTILFSCSDNGIGIPKDEQSKIFSKFYIASNVSKAKIKGTGIGLSIARALTLRMNGRIWFESEENKRTTFYLSLPFLM